MTPPVHIPGYEILSCIGKGGMGTVYRARQARLDRIVALKVIDPVIASEESFGKRFLKETHAAGKLSHENVVRAYDAGQTGGFYYICMECIDGESCYALLAREKRIEERRALTIALQVARALDHAHRQHLVHRDVKPGNILLTRDGTAKLCDFGLARDTASGSSITEKGLLIGSPWYMAPEQGAKRIDIRADLYSLGATLYHLLVGSPPFEGPTAMTVVMKHVMETPVPPGRRQPGISPSSDAIVLHALAKEPEDRYQTPAEMVKDIEDAVARFDAPTEEMPVQPPPPAPPPPRPPDTRITRIMRRPMPLLGLAVSLSFVALILVLVHHSQPRILSSVPAPAPVPVPEPVPEPEPDPIPVGSPDRAKVMLEEVEARAKGWKDHLDLVPSVLRRLEQIVADPTLQGDPWRDAAAARLAAFREEVEQEASRQLGLITEAAKPLTEQGRHYEAWLLYDAFPLTLAGTEAAEESSRVAASCRRREVQAVDAAWKTAEARMLEGHDDAALLALAGARELCGPEQKARIAEWEKEVNDAPYLRAAARETCDKLHASFLDSTSHRKPGEARAALEGALADEKNKWFKAEIEADLSDAKLVEAVFQDALRGARKLAETKESVTLPGVGANIRVEVEKDVPFLVTRDRARIRLDTGALALTDLALLAGQVLPSSDAETHLKYGLLFCLVGAPPSPGTEAFRRAEAELKLASSDPRAARALELLRRMREEKGK